MNVHVYLCISLLLVYPVFSQDFRSFAITVSDLCISILISAFAC